MRQRWGNQEGHSREHIQVWVHNNEVSGKCTHTCLMCCCVYKRVCCVFERWHWMHEKHTVQSFSWQHRAGDSFQRPSFSVPANARMIAGRGFGCVKSPFSNFRKFVFCFRSSPFSANKKHQCLCSQWRVLHTSQIASGSPLCRVLWRQSPFDLHRRLRHRYLCCFSLHFLVLFFSSK